MVVLRCAASCLALLAVAGCNAAERARESGTTASTAASFDTSGMSLFEPLPISSDRVYPGALAPIFETSLQSAGSGLPLKVSRIAVQGNRVYVLDTRQRALFTFSRRGERLRRWPDSTAAGPGHPIAIASVAESLFVLELSRPHGIHVLNLQGEWLSERPRRTGTSTTDLASSLTALAVGLLAPDSQLTQGTGRFIGLVGSAGDVIARGCQAHPAYAASLKRRGMLQLFRSIGVTADAGAIYCRQPVTPVVQVLDSTGRIVRVVRWTLPDYRAPSDAAESMNPRSIERFRSTWLEHMVFHPRPSGFLSVYATFDPVQGRDRYIVLACDSTAATLNCGRAESSYNPLAFLPPDTLVLSLPADSAHPLPRLLFTVMQRSGRQAP
jgi:hypothetical protein